MPIYELIYAHISSEMSKQKNRRTVERKTAQSAVSVLPFLFSPFYFFCVYTKNIKLFWWFYVGMIIFVDGNDNNNYELKK